VSLVYHEQPSSSCEIGKDLLAEVLVVESFGRHEQKIYAVSLELGPHAVPLLAVGAVDRFRDDASTHRHLDLIPHQSEERRDEQRRPRLFISEQPGRDEVHGALAPSRALDKQDATLPADHCLDRLKLSITECGICSSDATQEVERPILKGRPHLGGRVLRPRRGFTPLPCASGC
jgi:hypothetical protein